MAKRKLTLDQLRTLVCARRTKGDAFRLDHTTYLATQFRIQDELAAMSFVDIVNAYPEYTYDVK